MEYMKALSDLTIVSYLVHLGFSNGLNYFSVRYFT